MNNFLNFILLGKVMTIRANIRRKTTQYERNEMIMDSMGKGKLFGSGKNNFVEGEDTLEVGMNRGCLKSMNGVELGNNYRMTLFEDLFHEMGTDEPTGAYCDAL
jgi:hypothetical protein